MAGIEEVQSGLNKLVDDASKVADYLEGSGATIAKAKSLEAKAEEIEKKLQVMKEQHDLAERLAIAEKEKAAISTMALKLKDRVEKLEKLPQVIDGPGIQKSATELQARIASLEKAASERVSYDQVYADAMAKKEDLEKKAADLADRLDRVEKGAPAVQASDAPAESSADMASAQGAFEAAKAEQAKLVSEYFQSADTVADRIRELTSELEAQKSQRLVKNDAQDAKVESLQEENAKLSSELQDAVAQFKMFTGKNEDAVKRAQEEKTKLQSDLQDAMANMKILEGDIRDRNTTTGSDAATVKVLEGEKATLRSNLQDALANATKIQGQLDAALQEKVSIRTECQKSLNEATDKIAELEEIIQRVSAVGQPPPDAEVQQLQATVQSLTIQAQNQDMNNVALTKALEVKGAQIQKLSDQIRSKPVQDDTQDATVKSLQSQLVAASQEKVSIRIECQKSLKEATDKIAELEDIIQTMSTVGQPPPDAEVKIAELEDIIQRMSTVGQPPPDAEVKIAELEDIIQRMSTVGQPPPDAEVQQLQASVQSLTIQVQNQEMNIAALTKNIEVKDAQIQKLSDQIRSQPVRLATPSTSGSTSQTARLSGGGQSVTRGVTQPSEATSFASPLGSLSIPPQATITLSPQSPVPSDSSLNRGVTTSYRGQPIAAIDIISRGKTTAAPKRGVPAFTTRTPSTSGITTTRPGRTQQISQLYNSMGAGGPSRR